MTSYAKSHNFNAEYYNIDTGCHNFFRRKTFSSFKNSNEKIKLCALNTRWKAMATWPHRTKLCTPRRIFYTADGVQRISPQGIYKEA